MEVSVIGKALAPVSHDYMPHTSSDTGAEPRAKHLFLPLSKQYIGTQLSFEAKSKNEESWNQNNQKYDRARLNLTPAFHNMTLSETYNFARAQLKAYPIQQYKKRNLQTPTFAFTKAKLLSLTDVQKDDRKTAEVLSDPTTTPLVSCRSGIENTTTMRLLPESSRNAKSSERRHLSRRHAKSVCEYRRSRQKPSHKKKSSPNTASRGNTSRTADDARRVLMRLPNDLPIRCNLLPPKTQQPSVLLLRNICDKQNKDDDEILPTSRPKPIVKSCNSGDSLHPPNVNRVLKRDSFRFGVEDPLLASLDPSLSRRVKHGRQLSMRIQLIHKYGDEDVIRKHMEMRRKREAVDRHEKKNMENQANARLKEIQRSKIYALNTLMTKLEQEQFEEYKQSL